MNLHDHLKAYLTQTADLLRPLRPKSLKYSGMEEFVLREGRVMRLTKADPKVPRMTPKECFSNAATFMLEHPGYTYAEGFVMSAQLPIAIHHAWVLDPKGFVIDPTLGWERKSAYLGVEFQPEEVIRRITSSGYYGLFSNGFVVHDLVLGLDPDYPYRGEHAA